MGSRPERPWALQFAALKVDAPRRIVVAVPVAPRVALESMRAEVDEVIVVVVPDRFGAVGEWYDDFSPTTDAEVVALLRRGRGLDD